MSEGVFWVPPEARWDYLQRSAKRPDIGIIIDEAMAAIERDNPGLKGVLPQGYGREDLDKRRLGELIDLIGTIGWATARANPRTSWDASTNTFSASSLTPKAKKAVSSTPRPRLCGCWSRCSNLIEAASMTPAVDRVGCSCSRKNSSRRTVAAGTIFPSSAGIKPDHLEIVQNESRHSWD